MGAYLDLIERSHATCGANLRQHAAKMRARGLTAEARQLEWLADYQERRAAYLRGEGPAPTAEELLTWFRG